MPCIAYHYVHVIETGMSETAGNGCKSVLSSATQLFNLFQHLFRQMLVQEISAEFLKFWRLNQPGDHRVEFWFI